MITTGNRRDIATAIAHKLMNAMRAAVNEGHEPQPEDITARWGGGDGMVQVDVYAYHAESNTYSYSVLHRGGEYHDTAGRAIAMATIADALCGADAGFPQRRP